MKISDTSVGIDHSEIRPCSDGCRNIGFNCGFLISRQVLDFRNEISKTVFKIDSKSPENLGVFFEEILEINFNRMTKNNRVRNLHHGGFHMKGEQHSLIFRCSFLLSKETDKRRLAHAGRVDDFPGLQGNPFFKNSHRSVSRGVLNLDRSRTLDCDRFFVRSEITFGHGGDTGF